MKSTSRYILPVFLASVFAIACVGSGCKVHYGFSENNPSLPDSIKTVYVQYIDNHAAYVNPQLSPALTERLKQKITRQTKLSQTNNIGNAHLALTGEITEYSVTTSGISSANGQKQTSVNRLTVSVRLTLANQLSNTPPKDFTVSRQFDFSALQSLQSAEAQLLDEMVRNLSDEIFNRLFSDW